MLYTSVIPTGERNMCHMILNVVIVLVAGSFAAMAFTLYRAARTDWKKIYDNGYKDAILHYKLPGYETDTMRKRAGDV